MGGAISARVDGPSRPPISVVELCEGTFEVRATFHVSGDYRLHISIGGVPVIGSPFAMRVHPTLSSAIGRMSHRADEDDAVAARITEDAEARISGRYPPVSSRAWDLRV